MNKQYTENGQRIFIKYTNRKLYDVAERSYTTVLKIASLPLGSFVVLDNKTKKDITNKILLSALYFHFTNNIEEFETVQTELVQTFLHK